MIVGIERFIPKISNVFLPQPGGDATFQIVEMLLPADEKKPRRWELVVLSRDGLFWEVAF